MPGLRNEDPDQGDTLSALHDGASANGHALMPVAGIDDAGRNIKA